MTKFIPLHVHTEYSLLDGMIRVNDLVNYAKENELPAVAITDHGVMYGVVNFYNAAKKYGIKPIIGCEVYISARTRFDKIHEYVYCFFSSNIRKAVSLTLKCFHS